MIQNYLDRHPGIFERNDPEKRDRGIRAVKRLLAREYVIKPEEVPEGYFELQKWVDYLGSPDATFPDWLKYYAIRSIAGLGEYDKEKKQFIKCSSGTVKSWARTIFYRAYPFAHGDGVPDWVLSDRQYRPARAVCHLRFSKFLYYINAY